MNSNAKMSYGQIKTSIRINSFLLDKSVTLQLVLLYIVNKSYDKL